MLSGLIYVLFAIFFGVLSAFGCIVAEGFQKMLVGIFFLLTFIFVGAGVESLYEAGLRNPISPDKIQNQIYLFSGQVITSKGIVVIIEDTDQNVLAVWQTTDHGKGSLPLPENTQFVKISKDENQTSLVSADIAEKEDNPTSVAKETSQEE